MYDTVVVGMGPAGMTAAVYSARKKMNTLVIGKERGGQIVLASEVENYMGFQYISGPELMKKFEEHLKTYPVKIKQVEVERIDMADGHFVLKCKGEEKIATKTVIYAAGHFPRRLNVPGEKKFTGRGVSYCTVCDGPLFAGKKVAVIGGGNSALEAAHDLINIADHVNVVSLKEWVADPVLADKVQGANNITKYVGYDTKSIDGDKLVQGITLKSLETGEEKKLAVEGVFIHIGSIPSNGPVKDLVELNEKGEIMVDCSCNTNVPGFFAAGDVTNIPEKQVIVAAGEGAKASLSAYRYLTRRDSRKFFPMQSHPESEVAVDNVPNQLH